MAPLAVPLIIAGTGISAYGQIQAGQAAAAEGKSQQNLASYNAALQEREAKQVERKTAMEQRLQAEATDRAMGTTRANLGISGAISTEGSPLMLQAKMASEADLENITMGYEGREQATALRSGATLSRMEGKLANQRGKSARTASYIGAGSTLLSGFASSGMFSKTPSVTPGASPLAGGPKTDFSWSGMARR